MPDALRRGHGAAIYCLTPCDEATARRALKEAYSLPPPIRLALERDSERRSETALIGHGGTEPDDDDDDDDGPPSDY